MEERFWKFNAEQMYSNVLDSMSISSTVQYTKLQFIILHGKNIKNITWLVNCYTECPRGFVPTKKLTHYVWKRLLGHTVVLNCNTIRGFYCSLWSIDSLWCNLRIRGEYLEKKMCLFFFCWGGGGWGGSRNFWPDPFF